MTNPTPPLSLEQYRTKRKKLRNVTKEFHQHMGRMDRFAVWITTRIGTIGFFILIVIWTAFWLSWNLLAPKELQFDPPMGFVFWLFISNMIQIFLMPLIMVGQNIQSSQAEARAEHDLEVNIKAEEEIELILTHLEYQQSLLISMVQKLENNAK